MDKQINLTEEQFIKALTGEDERFFVVNAESSICQEAGMVVMNNVKVIDDVAIGMNKITSSWKGLPPEFPFRIRIENAIFQNVEFWSAAFHKPVFLINVVVEGDFDIRNGIYKTIRFDDVTIKKALRIWEGQFHSIRFYGGEFSLIHMYHPTITYLEIYENARIKQLDINNHYLVNSSGRSEEVIKFFTLSLPDDIIVNINEFKIGRLKLKGSFKSSTLILKNLKIGELFIDKFFSRGSNTIIFSNLKPLDNNSIISFTSSYLGNVVFFDVNFKSFNTLNILNTNLTDCIFNNVTWPEHIKVYDVDEIERDNKTGLKNLNESIEQLYSKQRENYRQLKHASSRQGDRAQELLFHSKEMKALRQSSKLLDVNNKPILWLSYLSNNHGLNWVYPVLWFFVVGAVFTLSIIYASGPNNTPSNLEHALVLPSSLHTIILYWDWSIYFAILNPTHRLEAIGEQVHNLNSAVVALDFFSRVLIAFLIYQVIVAFRKFNK